MTTILITTSSFGKIDSRPLDCLKDADLKVITNPYGRKLTENEALELITKYKPTGLVAGIEPLTKRVLEKAEDLRILSR